MKRFDKKIKEVAKHYGKPAIFDGIVNQKEYEKANPKILWILKEANSTGENESWNMREHINQKLKTESGIRKGWSATFKKIIYVTNGILNNITWSEELYHPGYKPSVIDELKKIAYINIKKIGGGSVANKNEIQEHYNFSKELLFEQINEFKPTIIIFGGTFKFFEKDLNLGKLKSFGSCNSKTKDGRTYVSAYHPMYTINEEIYFNDIKNAIGQTTS